MQYKIVNYVIFEPKWPSIFELKVVPYRNYFFKIFFLFPTKQDPEILIKWSKVDKNNIFFWSHLGDNLLLYHNFGQNVPGMFQFMLSTETMLFRSVPACPSPALFLIPIVNISILSCKNHCIGSNGDINPNV